MIVALGGDGLMLSTLHATDGRGLPVYGMNRGTVGFLMNTYRRGAAARAAGGGRGGGDQPAADARDARRRRRSVEALAINEVSMLRAGPQAAKLRILVDGRERMAELVADGALLCDAGGVDRLQLLGARADPADRRRTSWR